MPKVIDEDDIKNPEVTEKDMEEHYVDLGSLEYIESVLYGHRIRGIEKTVDSKNNLIDREVIFETCHLMDVGEYHSGKIRKNGFIGRIKSGKIKSMGIYFKNDRGLSENKYEYLGRVIFGRPDISKSLSMKSYAVVDVVCME